MAWRGRFHVLTSLVRWVLDHRRPTLWALLALMIFSGVGATRLKLDFSSRSLFADDDALAAHLTAFEQTWGPDDDQLFIVVRAVDGDDLWRPELLHDIHRLAKAAADVSGVAEVVDFTVLPLDRPGAPTTTLLGLADRGGSVPDARSLPFVPLLLAEDLKTAAVAVRLSTGSDDLAAIVPRVDALRTHLADEDVDALEWELAGVPAVRSAFFALTLRDQKRFVPASLALTALCLALLLRSVHGVVIPLVAAVIPTLMILGVMGWVGEPIGLLNQAYFTLIPVIAVADGVHMVVRVQRVAQLEDPGSTYEDPRRRAILTGVAGVGQACLLTSLTTGIGLASLGLAAMPTIRRFGWYAALAIVFAYLTVVVVVPLLLSYVDRTALARPHPRAAWLGRCALLATRHPWRIMMGAVFIMVLAGWGARAVVVDNALTGLLAKGHPVSAANGLLDHSLGGSLTVELELHGRPSELTGSTTKHALVSFTRWALAQDDVRTVRGVDPLYVKMRDGSGVARITLGVRDGGGQSFATLAAQVTRALRERLPAGTSVVATGTPLVAYTAINRMGDDLRRSLLAAFVVIAVVIGVLFRSLPLAVTAMIPNAMPLLFAYGMMGLLAIDLDPLGGIILTLALGIAVDDTVHVLARIREERRRGADAPAALRIAIEETGLALAITTFAVSVGLAINLASSFPPLVLLGGLGTSTMIIALVCDVLVLPALLTLAARRPARPASRAGSEFPKAG